MSNRRIEQHDNGKEEQGERERIRTGRQMFCAIILLNKITEQKLNYRIINMFYLSERVNN